MSGEDRGTIARRLPAEPAPADVPEDLQRVTWTCEVSGPGLHSGLPDGADLPMRRAVESAFMQIVGVEPDVISSGWGESPSLRLTTLEDVQRVAERLELVYVPEQHRLHAHPGERCNIDASYTEQRFGEERLDRVSPDVKLCEHCVSPEEARIIQAGLRR